MGVYAPEVHATRALIAAADAVVLMSCMFTMPDGRIMKPRMGLTVGFRGVGVEPAERLAAATRYGGVLYGPGGRR